MGAGLACRSWLEAAKLPELWRAVDMDKHDVVFRNDDDVLCAMAKAVVDRSDGQLRSFAGKLFVNDELMEYIAERSPLLTSLRLVSCRDLVLGSVMHESSLLELRSSSSTTLTSPAHRRRPDRPRRRLPSPGVCYCNSYDYNCYHVSDLFD
ncbi:hypothetical protein ZWY2020_025815 [Hordeum vulgare]|nr:hypothetical protein ZWY2020_025815 [Hordeum vulgare]